MSNGWTFPGLASYITPLGGFYGPSSDMGQTLFTHQGTICEQFELNFYRCCEAYGLVASKRKCDLEYRDFFECVFQEKQMHRNRAMRQERFRQFLEGKRDRPWTKNPPQIFGNYPDYYKHQNIQPMRVHP